MLRPLPGPAVQVGMQNSALGAVLASVHFPAHPLAAVPCAISGEAALPALWLVFRVLSPCRSGRLLLPGCWPFTPRASDVHQSFEHQMPALNSPPLCAACMHSVMGSLLAAVWRGRPTGELGTQDVEVEEPLAELAGAAAAVESAVESVVGSAASTVVDTVAAAGATVLTAAARSVGVVHRSSAGPGSSGSASFGRSLHGGSGSASFGRSVLPSVGRRAGSTAASSSGAASSSLAAVSNQGSQGAGLACSGSGDDGGSGTQQRLSQQEMQRLLGDDF